MATIKEGSLEDARLTQATVLGEDLLVSFSNGSSALLSAQDVMRLVITSAKTVVTDADAAELDAHGLVGPEGL